MSGQANTIQSIMVMSERGCEFTATAGFDGCEKIAEENVHIEGDPFMHYIGRDKHGLKLFKVSGKCNVIVNYYKCEPA